MTVYITLTSAGSDTGPFNLYSDLDGFLNPFEVGVDKALLLAGYSSSLVPDYTSTIRVKSTSTYCINYTDVTVATTTTIAPLDFEISSSCTDGNGTININTFTGGTGGYLVGNNYFTDEASALANSSWVSATSFSIGVGPAIGGTYWMVIKDSSNTLKTKSIVVNCI